MQNYRPSNHEKSYPVLKIRELRQGYCDFNSDLCSSSNIDEEYIIKIMMLYSLGQAVYW